ncbi:hypothetical protein FHY29_001466 [Xanthomonas arboricola]|uniref:hypothetical protein n=1 Tax=Xanthomonas arboricola TaxID=56448 RepID=UPI0011B0DFBC|nr:hypothetical protein [Xanthomonas arboricola]
MGSHLLEKSFPRYASRVMVACLQAPGGNPRSSRRNFQRPRIIDARQWNTTHAAKKGDDAAPTAAPRRRQIALFLTAMLLGARGQQPPTFAGSDDY